MMGHCMFMRKGETHTAPSHLPSGYTKLDYIQSSGTQYIDTGFKANQDTKVVCDFELVVSASGSSAIAIFGARTDTQSKTYNLIALNNSLRSDYNTSIGTPVSANQLQRRIVTKDKNVTNIDGSAQTISYASFQTEYNLYLFSNNIAGTASWMGSLKIYACQIYDNGTLVRDFLPCINASGDVGLYDLVGKKFYANAGSGAFTSSEVQEVIVPITASNMSITILQ